MKLSRTMVHSNSIKVFLVLILSFIFASSAQRQVYVVYLGEHDGQKTLQEIEEHHHSYLHRVKGSLEEVESSIIYSYGKVINGFSAFLTPEEADAISAMNGVISVFKDKPQKPHTSRSWDFVSLLEADWNPTQADGMKELLDRANGGMDIVVGVMDTGIWPESQSFDDSGMDPVPTTWKGTCDTGDQFNTSHCNRKLIGARFFLKGYEARYGPVNPEVEFRSPRDRNGHGTHVAATVGGRRVANAAAVGGFGRGTVRGGAPLVRLAAYKICWNAPEGVLACLQSDALAGFDEAIADGVHVISASVGENLSFREDNNAIGALHAAKRDIVVSFAAGNGGPRAGSVINVAPWAICVGANSIDRIFPSPLLLGSGYVAQGQSVEPFQRATYELVYAGDIENEGSTTNQTSGECLNGTLSPALTRGKAVFCLGRTFFREREVQRAGGAAIVIRNANPGIEVYVGRTRIPSTYVYANETNAILTYIQNSSHGATATLTPGKTIIGIKPAPFMASFSARGPAAIEPNILKPDITAPGLSILAAYSEALSPDDKFTFSSGTSMSCPHVSAVAALLRAIHPTWSNAAIRSAIMTTASLTNNVGSPITEASSAPATPFAYGSGHIQPSKAADPGLVYDAAYTDYLLFLCASINDTLDSAHKCPTSGVPPQSNLNYPSLSIANVNGAMKVPRRVTNVGNGSTTYLVKIDQPRGYSVQISPSKLHFNATGQTLGFNISIVAESSAVRNEYAFGSYTWSDGVHQVRSPMVLSTNSKSVTTTPHAEVHWTA